MYLTERGVNSKGAMRTGGKVVQVHIIRISRGKIGIGRLIHHIEIRGLISGKLLMEVLVIYYLITTQFWVMTGNGHNYRDIRQLPSL